MAVRALVKDQEQDNVEELLEWVRQHGHHRCWHDLESLLLCPLTAVIPKWRKEVRGLDMLLKQWYSEGSASATRGQWPDTQAAQLEDLVWRQQRLHPWKKEVAGLLAGMFRVMRPAFEGSVGGERDSLLQVIKQAYDPLLKAAPFTTVLQKLIETIPLVEAVEQRPSSPCPQPRSASARCGVATMLKRAAARSPSETE